MSPAEHLIVLVSIIIGLAITDLLSSLRHLIRNRERVRFHWLPLTWTVLIFLQLVQVWWIYFYVLQAEIWRNYFAFAFFLMVPVLLYLIASWILPDRDEAGQVDLREYYFRENGWIFGLISLAVVVQIGSELLQGGDPLHPARIFQLTAAGLFASLAWTKNLLYHGVVTLFLAGLFVTFVVVYTVRLISRSGGAGDQGSRGQGVVGRTWARHSLRPAAPRAAGRRRLPRSIAVRSVVTEFLYDLVVQPENEQSRGPLPDKLGVALPVEKAERQ